MRQVWATVVDIERENWALPGKPITMQDSPHLNGQLLPTGQRAH
jgi:hypothetical protein